MIEANCRTTAMGIMPHTDISQAMELALSLDIPFWPQLPRISFYHDMYAQTALNFPGISADIETRKLCFSTARFEQELWDYSGNIGSDDTFLITGKYASGLDEFLKRDLSSYHAVRGQVAGPVSLGFNVLDEDRKPIIYNDEVRALLFDFVPRKVNAQYHELQKRNSRAFVWIDDPALSYVFSSMYGYNDRQAWQDYQGMLESLDGTKGLHLCTNVNLPYLLQLGVEILSFDAYQMGLMPREYAAAAAEFLGRGGILCWGIVPTATEMLEQEAAETLSLRLLGYWEAISRYGGLRLEQIAAQSLLAPAKCSIKDFWRSRAAAEQDVDCRASSVEETAVAKAFACLKEISRLLKDKFRF